MMLLLVVVITTKEWEQTTYLSPEEWMGKMCYIHAGNISQYKEYGTNS